MFMLETIFLMQSTQTLNGIKGRLINSFREKSKNLVKIHFHL